MSKLENNLWKWDFKPNFTIKSTTTLTTLPDTKITVHKSGDISVKIAGNKRFVESNDTTNLTFSTIGSGNRVILSKNLHYGLNKFHFTGWLSDNSNHNLNLDIVKNTILSTLRKKKVILSKFDVQFILIVKKEKKIIHQRKLKIFFKQRLTDVKILNTSDNGKHIVHGTFEITEPLFPFRWKWKGQLDKWNSMISDYDGESNVIEKRVTIRNVISRNPGVSAIFREGNYLIKKNGRVIEVGPESSQERLARLEKRTAELDLGNSDALKSDLSSTNYRQKRNNQHKSNMCRVRGCKKLLNVDALKKRVCDDCWKEKSLTCKLCNNKFKSPGYQGKKAICKKCRNER